MATAEEYAQWIVKNSDKKGTQEFDIVSAAYQEAKATTPDVYAKTAGKMPFLEQAAAGFGGALKGMELGARQLAGYVAPSVKPSESDIAEYEQSMSGLRETGGGIAGEIGGTLATMIPAGAGAFRAATALPAIGEKIARATLTPQGRAAISAVGGGSQAALIPVSEDESRGLNVAGGTVLAGGASRLIDSLMGKMAARKAGEAIRSPLAKTMPEAQTAIAEAAKTLTPQSAAELERMQLLSRLPVPITEKDVIRSQITRDYPQQEAERLVSGQPFIGKELTARLASGQEKMGANIEALAAKTGAKAPSAEAAGETVREWMQNIYGAAKKDTSAAYDYARKLHGDKKFYPETDLLKTLSENRAMPGYKELYSQARNMGMLVPKADGTKLVAGRITVNELDKFKSLANNLAQSSDGMTRYAGGDIVNKVYNQLDNVAPEFKEAAKLRKRQGEMFEDPTITKKILGTVEGRLGAAEKEVGGITIPNYKVANEKLIDTITGSHINDLRYIRNMAVTGTKEQKTQGIQAIKEMRGAIIDDMRGLWEKTRTPQSKANVLDRYFEKLGNEKIEILFGKAGSRQIKDFRESAAIMNRGVPSPEGGPQTAGRLMNMGNHVISLLGRLPYVGTAGAKGIEVMRDIKTAKAGTKVPTIENTLTKALREHELAKMAASKEVKAGRKIAQYGALPALQGYQGR